MIFEIAFFAIAEELFKAALCRAISWRKFWLFPVLAFAIFEALLKIPAISLLPSELSDSELKFQVAVFAAVGTSIFHLYTSLLYLWTRNLWFAVVIGGAVHVLFNLVVRYDKTFQVLDFKSLVLGWAYTTICGIVFLAYFKLESSLFRPGHS